MREVFLIYICFGKRETDIEFNKRRVPSVKQPSGEAGGLFVDSRDYSWIAFS